jgi:hypothetical protein
MSDHQKRTFHVESVRLNAHASRATCKQAAIALDTDESDQRLKLLHDNVKKYGTVFNTVAPGTDLQGVLIRQGTGR